MANGINKAILIGNLGDDPKVSSTAGGMTRATFSIATGESWTDQNNVRQTRTEWHRIVVWNKLADLCKQYLTKGRQIYLEGKMTNRSWTDQDGQTRYTNEIVAQNITFLGPNPNGNNGEFQSRGNGNGNGGGNGNAPSQQVAPQGQPNDFSVPDMDNSEIPF